VASKKIVSYAQNGEDVVLWRALGHIHDGIYVDVGGFDPDSDSVTRLFYEHGWRGVDVEPVPAFAERFRARRPGNEVVQAAVTDQDVEEIALHRVGSTGLSTVVDDVAARHTGAGLEYVDLRVRAQRLDDILEASRLVDETIHFLKVDVEGAEDQVLRSLDLKRWRPWVMVVEATAPNSTESTHEAWEPLLLDAGYAFTLFDGLSRFYVADEHPELEAALSYPACVLDGYVTATHVALEREVSELAQAGAEATRWRNQAVAYWAESMASTQAVDDVTRQAELDRERLTIQLQRSREKAQLARKERNQLRNEVARTADRAKRMQAKISRLQTRIEELERPQAGTARSVLGRLRRAVRGAPQE
jgi:FkbM family methyltransferase